MTTLDLMVYYSGTHEQQSNIAQHSCVVLIYTILLGTHSSQSASDHDNTRSDGTLYSGGCEQESNLAEY